MKEVLKHLLIKGEFKVWCTGRAAGSLEVTIYPSKTTCANCLSRYRWAYGRKKRFCVTHTGREIRKDL